MLQRIYKEQQESSECEAERDSMLEDIGTNNIFVHQNSEQGDTPPADHSSRTHFPTCFSASVAEGQKDTKFEDYLMSLGLSKCFLATIKEVSKGPAYVPRVENETACTATT